MDLMKIAEEAFATPKKELDESSPYSFVAKEEKAGKKIIGCSYPHQRP